MQWKLKNKALPRPLESLVSVKDLRKVLEDKALPRPLDSLESVKYLKKFLDESATPPSSPPLLKDEAMKFKKVTYLPNRKQISEKTRAENERALGIGAYRLLVEPPPTPEKCSVQLNWRETLLAQRTSGTFVRAEAENEFAWNPDITCTFCQGLKHAPAG